MQNLKQFDLNLLKAFDALFDEQSVTKAADRLAITQPAMSGILTRLREGFDDPLFVRVQRGVQPTELAETLAPLIKQILQRAEQLLQPAAFEPQQAELTLKIVGTDYALQAVVQPLILRLRQLAPKIKIAFLALNNAEIQRQLEQGLVDFALMTPEFSAPNLYAKTLYAEHYICAVGNQHPLAQQKMLSLQQFCQTDQLLVSYQGGSFSGVTDQALAEQGLTRNVVLSIQHFSAVTDLLRQTDLLAVVPQKLVENLNGITTFPPPVAITGFHKTLVWHQRTHHSPAHCWVREQIVELFK